MTRAESGWRSLPIGDLLVSSYHWSSRYLANLIEQLVYIALKSDTALTRQVADGSAGYCRSVERGSSP